MEINNIVGYVLLIVVFAALATLEAITILQNHKLEKEINEYKTYSDFLFKRQRIAREKKVDYKSLEESNDYLTYNSKVNSEDRKLTKEEFNVLKLNYLFYVWPKAKFISEEREENL